VGCVAGGLQGDVISAALLFGRWQPLQDPFPDATCVAAEFSDRLSNLRVSGGYIADLQAQ
jgi:hypothetical protein